MEQYKEALNCVSVLRKRIKTLNSFSEIRRNSLVIECNKCAELLKRLDLPSIENSLNHFISEIQDIEAMSMSNSISGTNSVFKDNLGSINDDLIKIEWVLDDILKSNKQL